MEDDQGLIAPKGIKTSLWPSQFCHCGLTSRFPTVAPHLPWDVEGVSTTPLAAGDRSCSGSCAADWGSALRPKSALYQQENCPPVLV